MTTIVLVRKNNEVVVAGDGQVSMGNTVVKSTASKISNITIFNNGASINRIGKIVLNKGANKILISNLSSKLLSESIQFRVFSNEVIINSVSKQNNFLSLENNSQVGYFEDSLNKINEKIRLTKINLEVFKEEKDLLDQNKSVLKTSREFIVEDLMDLADYFKENIKEIQTNISQTKKRITELNNIKNNIEHQIKSIRSTVKNQSCELIVQTTSLKSGEFNFELSYNTLQAGWVPCYEVRADKINDPLILTYKAKVFQNTNEVWSEVKLSLSTGLLNKSNTAPSFNTQYISSNNSKNNIRGNRPAAMQFKSMVSQDNDEAQESSTSSASYSRVDYSGTQIKYDISIPYSIPSQKEPIFIEIQKFDAQANYDYYCYPKIDKDVFLMCHFEKLKNKNLLAGNAQIYFEGNSVGSSYFDPYSTKKIIDLSLNRDISIISERKLETKLSSETTLGDNIKIEKSYKITLENNKNKPIDLVLVDQIPVSTKKNIDVQVVENSEANYTKSNGRLLWNIHLNPNEKIEKVFTYSVKYPEKQNIYGY